MMANARKVQILFGPSALVEMNNMTHREYELKCQERTRLYYELEMY